jgi:hypothetical protein
MRVLEDGLPEPTTDQPTTRPIDDTTPGTTA